MCGGEGTAGGAPTVWQLLEASTAASSPAVMPTTPLTRQALAEHLMHHTVSAVHILTKRE